jgi:DNA-binding transcriptional regulator YiaG
MPTKRAVKNTEQRGLLMEDLHPRSDQDQNGRSSVVWAQLVADHGGTNPFVSKSFLLQVASGEARVPALGGRWPATGPKQWRQNAGVTALQVAYVLHVPETLVEAWENGDEPCPDNWRGAERLDDMSARRLYAAFKGYSEGAPYPEPPKPEPVPGRPPVKVVGGEGFPRKELLEAANLGYEVEPVDLAGEGRFLRVVVLGQVPGIPALADVPAGEELKRIRAACNYSQERWGTVLGAPASRVQAWEDGITLPGADCDGGLAAALRLYGTCQSILELREASTSTGEAA